MAISSPIGGKMQPYVKEIINAEREPIRRIEARKAKENEKLKLVQEFAGKVRKLPETFRELESFKKFRELKCDLPGPAKELMDAIIDKDKAEPGEYSLEVVQLAGRPSMISDGYESPDDEIGVGYFSYETPDGDTKSVWIGPGNNTLKGIVSAINSEKDLGLQASLINDGGGGDRPWRVVVSGKKSGVSNDTIWPDFYFLDGDFRFNVDDERESQNAIIKFNGFEIMSDANKFELLPGVTIDLKQAKEGYEFNFAITEDTTKISGKVKALVDAINQVLEFVNKQNKLDAQSDTSRTLGGDTALFTIESRLRSLVFEGYHVDPDNDDAVMRLSDIGIQFEKTGSLTFKEDKFKKVLTDHYDYIAEMFTAEGNLIDRLKFITDGFLRPETGAVTARESGIRMRIRQIDDEIARREAQLSRREGQLKRQFAQLEAMQQAMAQQQSYLTQAMGSPSLLPGM